MQPVAKILGADVELGNIVERIDGVAVPNEVAARLLLAEIHGVPSLAPAARAAWPPTSAWTREAAADPQDWGRRFLPGNGGCAYIDLGHLEICMPEVRSARDFVCWHHAGLALARAARTAAAAQLPDQARLVLMANNSDRLGHSWGGHLNVLVTRELWQRLFRRLYPELFVLAAFQVSSIVYTGQGKVGAENGRAAVPFQLTQRGDFFECLEGEQTTFNRPIVNARDEPHCGGADSGLARLHVIFHDTTLTHWSNYLKAGATQLVLALMETGWCDRRTMLADPIEALTRWGHDPQLRADAALADGPGIGAIEHQRLFLAAAKDFVERGDAGCVPEAERIVAAWEDTLDRLERRDFAVLARRLDWVLKHELLARAIERNPALHWESPAIRAADLRFASLGASDGLYEAVAAADGIDRLVSDEAVAYAASSPPEDTRAWLRALLLRHAGAQRIEAVNWDHIRLRGSRPGAASRVVALDDPRRHGRAEVFPPRAIGDRAAVHEDTA